MMETKKAIMLFAAGYEEVEALMTVDLLKRGGVEVTLVSVSGESMLQGSHGIGVAMDEALERVNIKEADAVIIPGGMPGTLNLAESETVCQTLTNADREGKIVAAICAAPTVLGKCGILKGKKATCYPGYEEQLGGAEFVDQMVVTDGNIVTSRGLGTAMEFGLKLVEMLVSEEKAAEVRSQIVFMYE